jgi:hypothetical protein
LIAASGKILYFTGTPELTPVDDLDSDQDSGIKTRYKRNVFTLMFKGEPHIEEGMIIIVAKVSFCFSSPSPFFPPHSCRFYSISASLLPLFDSIQQLNLEIDFTQRNAYANHTRMCCSMLFTLIGFSFGGLYDYYYAEGPKYQFYIARYLFCLAGLVCIFLAVKFREYVEYITLGVCSIVVFFLIFLYLFIVY